MEDPLSVDIGGIRLAVTSDLPLADLDPSDSVYPSFLLRDDSPATPSIHIRIACAENPRPEGLVKVFDTEQHWSLYRDGDERILSSEPSAFAPVAMWTARVNQDVTDVLVTCGKTMVRTIDGKTVLRNPVRYPLDQMLMMYAWARREGAIVHACGINLNGKGAAFLGRSGAGKSTLARVFAGQEDIRVLSDDRVVIRNMDNTPQMFGTPWPGDAGMALNESVPLAALFFLHQDVENRAERIEPGQALERLLPVTSIPWYDPEVFPAILDFCGELATTVPAYDLHFTPTLDVLDVIEL
jgi:hypothetical protein